MTQIGIRKTIPTLLFLVITARLDEAHKSQESENVPTSQEASPFDAEYLDRVWGGLSWKREHEMETLNITLHLKIHPINPTALLWEPATAIASYLEESCEENNWVRGKKVLELGAGLGLPGLAAACLGGNVTVTDKPELLPWLQHGIDLNLKSIQNTSGEIRAEVLIWGDDEKIRSMPRQDLIIVSEAIYDISTVDDLISTIGSSFSR
nr:PREDICTED: protein-lysine methyltransferase METTL21C-like [Bemisia tabaci]